MTAKADVDWPAGNKDRDSAMKEKILSRALNQAETWVFNDMVKYLQRKNAFAARRVSGA